MSIILFIVPPKHDGNVKNNNVLMIRVISRPSLVFTQKMTTNFVDLTIIYFDVKKNRSSCTNR